jgi:hypothetical protein
VHAADNTHSSITHRSVDFEGQDTAVAITSDGAFVIAYYNTFTKDLILDVFPTPLTDMGNRYTTTVDSSGDVGKGVDIALTSTNTVVMSYYDETNGNLKYASCSIPCRTPVVTSIIDSDSGLLIGVHPDIEVASDDLAVIAHKDQQGDYLFLTVCRNASCTRNETNVLARIGGTYLGIGLALTAADKPIIAYADAIDGDTNNHDLKMIYCDDITCSTNNTALVDASGNAGYGIDISLGAYDEPYISYVEYGSKTLKVAFCANIVNCATSMTILGNSTFGVSGVNDTAIDLNFVAAYQYHPVITVFNDLSDTAQIITCSNKCASVYATPVNLIGGYGISLATRSGKTIAGYYDNGANIYLYTDDTYPLGTSSASTSWLMLAGEHPESFNKTLPGNRSAVSQTSVTLKSNMSSLASLYEYCFSTSTTTCTNWQRFSWWGGITKTGLINNRTYYWQVRAINNIGTTYANSGTLWQFTVRLRPTSFAKSAPANNAKNQSTIVTLKWNASTRATSYEYCIALSTSACTNWKSTGTARQVTVRNLAKNKTYFWQVRAKNAGGTTLSNTTFWKFTTAR